MHDAPSPARTTTRTSSVKKGNAFDTLLSTSRIRACPVGSLLKQPVVPAGRAGGEHRFRRGSARARGGLGGLVAAAEARLHARARDLLEDSDDVVDGIRRASTPSGKRGGRNLPSRSG